MLTKEEINRINELGRLSRERSLTESELAEQKRLREAYLVWFRSSLRGNAEPSKKDTDEEKGA